MDLGYCIHSVQTSELGGGKKPPVSIIAGIRVPSECRERELSLGEAFVCSSTGAKPETAAPVCIPPHIHQQVAVRARMNVSSA